MNDEMLLESETIEHFLLQNFSQFLEKLEIFLCR